MMKWKFESSISNVGLGKSKILIFHSLVSVNNIFSLMMQFFLFSWYSHRLNANLNAAFDI